MNEKKKILLVEDDKNLGSVLKDFLSIKNYDVTLAEDGLRGKKEYDRSKFALIILDVMMPGKDGFTLAEEIRKNDKHTPIIFLTAKSMSEDRIRGLKLGGDDYITKPFSSEELFLRIENIFKRSQNYFNKPEQSIFDIGKYKFDFGKRQLTINSVTQRLTTKEAQLLRLLAINKNEVLIRSTALNEIWKNETYFTARSMDVYITKLRAYLKADKSIEIINLHGTGYKLID
jgi:DNA-binding response OmpR family regulator